MRADLDQVTISLGGELVARHRRSLVPHQLVSDPAHAVARASLRDERRALLGGAVESEVEVRDLAVSDPLLELAQ